MTIAVVAYVAVGLVAGVIAARHEYRDGAIGGHLDSAGVVGMFTASFWPVVALVLLFGLVARSIEATRPK